MYFFCSPRYWIFNMIGCTPLKAKRSKREVFSAFECSLSLLTVGGNWQWSPQSTNCLQPWQIGTNVAGSVACDASSISTSWGRRIWDIGWRWKVHHLTPRVSKKYQLSPQNGMVNQNILKFWTQFPREIESPSKGHFQHSLQCNIQLELLGLPCVELVVVGCSLTHHLPCHYHPIKSWKKPPWYRDTSIILPHLCGEYLSCLPCFAISQVTNFWKTSHSKRFGRNILHGALCQLRSGTFRSSNTCEGNVSRFRYQHTKIASQRSLKVMFRQVTHHFDVLLQ